MIMIICSGVSSMTIDLQDDHLIQSVRTFRRYYRLCVRQAKVTLCGLLLSCHFSAIVFTSVHVRRFDLYSIVLSLLFARSRCLYANHIDRLCCIKNTDNEPVVSPTKATTKRDWQHLCLHPGEKDKWYTKDLRSATSFRCYVWLAQHLIDTTLSPTLTSHWETDGIPIYLVVHVRVTK